jgi:hypothetical protein
VRLIPENFAVHDLIEMIDRGDLALPEFQRDFIWQPPQVADVLRTVARRWPA